MLFIFLLAHPHLLEAAQTGQYWAANPRTESLFSPAHHFHLHILGCHFWKHALESLREALQTAVSARDYHILEQVSADVNVCAPNSLHDQILHASKTSIISSREHIYRRCSSCLTSDVFIVCHCWLWHSI